MTDLNGLQRNIEPGTNMKTIETKYEVLIRRYGFGGIYWYLHRETSIKREAQREARKLVLRFGKNNVQIYCYRTTGCNIPLI